MRRLIAALVLAAGVTYCGAGEVVPVVTGDTVTIVKKLPFTVTVPARDGALYRWYHPSAIKSTGKSTRTLTVTEAPTGETVFEVSVTWFDKATQTLKQDDGVVTVTLGQVPVPPGPTPDPGPGPQPPSPPGPLPPAPIPVEGFRVLIVEDANMRVKLPKPQQAIMFDSSLRDYLDSKCVMGKDGKTREWRIWPTGADYSKTEKHWQDVMKRERKSLPWIIISDGKTGYEGPLPENVDKTLELVKKYAPTTSNKQRGGK